MGINLKSFVFSLPKVDTTAGDVLKKLEEREQHKKHLEKQGLVTSGYLEIIYSSSGGNWAVSDLIAFPYSYTQAPIFTWGLEGTYSGDSTNESPYKLLGTNTYADKLPQPLLDYIAAEDTYTFSPAIFIPRIIHWYKKSSIHWNGCYLLVCQVNPYCTEKDNKKLKLHFRFEGPGYL